MLNVGIVELVTWLATVAVVLAIGVLIIVAGRRIVGYRGADPRTTLRKRLVRGEITQAELEEATRILGH
jgi:hypothetical protein